MDLPSEEGNAIGITVKKGQKSSSAKIRKAENVGLGKEGHFLGI